MPEQNRESHEIKGEEDVAASTGEAAIHSERSGTLRPNLEGLLDKIDEALGVNAEEFVRSDVKKGGE